jgi:hypothetical protein
MAASGVACPVLTQKLLLELQDVARKLFECTVMLRAACLLASKRMEAA